jgi:tetratricopeptide (TPR) repeat protein
MCFTTAVGLSEEFAARQRPDDALRSADDAEAALQRYKVRAKKPDAELIVLRGQSDLITARARIYEDLGNTAKLGDARKRAVEVCREVVARRPSHSIFRGQLAMALMYQGRYLSNTDRPEEGLQAVREARQLCEAIYRADTSESSAAVFGTLTGSWSLEGAIHYEAGRHEDAIAAFREVSRLYEGQPAHAANPNSVAQLAGNEYNLGMLLTDAGRTDEAMASYRRSLDLRRALARDHPDRPEYRLNVAFTLGNMGTCVAPTDLPAAEGYLRETVAILADLATKFPKAAVIRDGLPRNRASLAGVLYDQGKLDEAATLYQENLRANPKDQHSRKQTTQIEGARKLLPRLPDILSGAARPATPAEAVEFAGLCTERFQRRYAAAARLFAEAFVADPELSTKYPAAAAVAAARAARGDGADAPTDPATRAALRAQALDWLRLDLETRRKQAASWSAAERKQATDELASWLKASTLSGLRPGLARIGMPVAERAEWDALWADVKATLTDARKPAPPPETAPPPRARSRPR